jgi:hypothetical protein
MTSSQLGDAPPGRRERAGARSMSLRPAEPDSASRLAYPPCTLMSGNGVADDWMARRFGIAIFL